MLLFIVTLIVFIFTEHKHYYLPETQTGLVIDKSHSFVFGDEIKILHNDSTVGTFNCYDILYNQIEVGDSIINGKVKKNEKN